MLTVQGFVQTLSPAETPKTESRGGGAAETTAQLSPVSPVSPSLLSSLLVSFHPLLLLSRLCLPLLSFSSVLSSPPLFPSTPSPLSYILLSSPLLSPTPLRTLPRTNSSSSSKCSYVLLQAVDALTVTRGRQEQLVRTRVGTTERQWTESQHTLRESIACQHHSSTKRRTPCRVAHLVHPATRWACWRDPLLVAGFVGEILIGGMLVGGMLVGGMLVGGKANRCASSPAGGRRPARVAAREPSAWRGDLRRDGARCLAVGETVILLALSHRLC